MIPISPLKTLLRSKLGGKLPKEVETSAALALQKHLIETANIIAEEASNGNYYRVLPMDVDRGVELVRLRHIRDYLQGKDSLVIVKSEIDSRIALMMPKASSSTPSS
jgi:hypothetical protein